MRFSRIIPNGRGRFDRFLFPNPNTTPVEQQRETPGRGVLGWPIFDDKLAALNLIGGRTHLEDSRANQIGGNIIATPEQMGKSWYNGLGHPKPLRLSALTRGTSFTTFDLSASALLSSYVFVFALTSGFSSLAHW